MSGELIEGFSEWITSARSSILSAIVICLATLSADQLPPWTRSPFTKILIFLAISAFAAFALGAVTRGLSMVLGSREASLLEFSRGYFALIGLVVFALSLEVTANLVWPEGSHAHLLVGILVRSAVAACLLLNSRWLLGLRDRRQALAALGLALLVVGSVFFAPKGTMPRWKMVSRHPQLIVVPVRMPAGSQPVSRVLSEIDQSFETLKTAR